MGTNKSDTVWRTGETVTLKNQSESLEIIYHGDPDRLLETESWTEAEQFFKSQSPANSLIELVMDGRRTDLVDQAVLNLTDRGFVFRQLNYDEQSARLQFLTDDSGGCRNNQLFLRRVRDNRVFKLDNHKQHFLGRSRDCDIRLDSPHASAIHCSISFHRRVLGLVDLHSRAGSYLNNRPIIRSFIAGEGSSQSGQDELFGYGLICLGRKETGHYLEMEVHLQRARAPYFYVISGANAGQTISLTTANATVGRSISSSIRVKAPYISRNHMRVLVFENCFLIVDHESANGTRLRESPIHIGRLVPGDRILAAGEQFDVLHEVNSVPQPDSYGLRSEGKIFPLRPDFTNIGSHPRCEIHLEASALSRFQARVVNNRGKLHFYNLCGAAPTYLNDNPIADSVLVPGDVLTLGNRNFTVVQRTETASDSTRRPEPASLERPDISVPNGPQSDEGVQG